MLQSDLIEHNLKAQEFALGYMYKTLNFKINVE